MGDSINTPGIERSPFIHHDNQTFYYSTDGKPGMGGADLYMSKINQGGVWSASINLGYPINTQFDEVGLVVNAKGNRAYFSSDRLSEKGRDIYEFEMYPEIRPIEVSYMKGKIFNAETKKRLFARFELIDLGSTEITMEAYSDEETGEFLVCIPTGKDYALNVSKKGYLFFSENFALKDIFELAEPYLVDIPLQPVKSGERIILRNIFYETDSYELKKESMVELNKLLQFIIENPELRLEISGHTDSDGPDEYNLSLSENRAKSVVNFLLENNVGKDLIVYKGYGETLPLESNDTEEGRSGNRRTEVKILGK